MEFVKIRWLTALFLQVGPFFMSQSRLQTNIVFLDRIGVIAMKRLRLLGLSLLLLVVSMFFTASAFGEHPWTVEAPQYGKDTDMGGGKMGGQESLNKWTKQDVFTSSAFVQVLTTKITLLIVDWQTDNAVLQVSPTEGQNTSHSRSAGTTDAYR